MARFDWKQAICDIGVSVEGSLMCADRLEREGWGDPENLREEARHHAEYAAWLARSYNRKGIRRNERHS